MKKNNKVITTMILVIWDIAVAIFSIYTAASYVFGKTKGTGISLFGYYSILSAILLVTFSALFKCYNYILRHIGANELIRQFFAVFTSSVVLTLIIKFDRRLAFGMALEIAALTGAMQLMLTVLARIFPKATRWCIAIWKKRYMASDNIKKVIIIGAGDAGTYLAKKLQSDIDDNRLPVAFIDDDPSMWGKTISGIPVFGGQDKIKDAAEEYNADEIIIAIPSADRQTMKEFYELCSDTKCALKRYGNLMDINEQGLDKITIDDIQLEDLLGRDVVELDLGVINTFIQGKVVLVTGGAGSIGSEICRQVLQYGAKHLIIFDIHENGLFEIDRELSLKYGDTDLYTLALGSIRDIDRVEEIFEEYRPDIVFHAAAHKHVPMMEWNPKEAIKNNVFGTMNVARMSDRYGAQKFILISTDKAVNPTNIMGASKRIAEMFIQTFNESSNTEFAAVRFGNVLGSNGSVIPTFKKQIEMGGPVTVTHRDIERYFMTIPEAVQLVLEAGAMAKGGEIFVLDMGEPIKIYDLACTLIRLAGLEPHRDIKIEFTGLRPGEKMYEEINFSNEEVAKTANNKIYVMQANGYDPNLLFEEIDKFQILLKSKDIEELYRQVKKLVPTFNYKICDENIHCGKRRIYKKESTYETGAV